MDIVREAVNEFWVGHGGADAVARPLVTSGYAPQEVLKGVRVRATTVNTIVIYVGRVGVTVNSGYPLPAGEELTLPIEDISTIYVIATPAGNSQQVITISGDIVGETFTLTLDGETTASIIVEATAAAVEDALEVLANIGVGNVAVSGNVGGPYTVEFIVALAKTDMSLMTGTDGGINEKQTVGIPNTVDVGTFTLTYSGQTTAAITYSAVAAAVQTALENLSNIEVGDVEVTGGPGPGTDWVVEFKGLLAKTDVAAMTATSSCGQNEKQTVGIPNTVDVGTFTLTYSGQTTAAIAFDAVAGTVQIALENLSNIAVGDVLVTGGPGPGTDWVVEFKGLLAITDVAAMTATSSCGQNEKQTIVVTLAEVNDKLVLTYDGQSTGELAYDSTSAQIATALKALSNIEDADVSVTDGNPAGWVVEFTGALAMTDVPAITGVCGINEKQTVGIPNTVDVGTFTLTYSGQTTAAIAYSAVAAAVQTALENLSNIAVGDVEVTGGPGPGTDWVVEFKGLLAKTDVAAMTATSSCGQNEKQTVGIPNTVDVGTFTLTYSGQTTAAITYSAVAAAVQTALENLSNIEVGDVEVTGGPGPGTDWVVEFKGALTITDVAAMTATSSCGQNEKQTVAIDDATTSGTLTLTYSGQTTAAIAFDAVAAAVQTALENLSNIEVGDVEVTGGPGPSADWVVEFKGTLAITDVAAMTGDGSNLVGGSTTVTITETVKGVTETVTITEAVKGVTETVTITETVSGNLATVGVTETVKGITETVTITEAVKGVTETVTITETQKGDASFSITITKTDASAGSLFSWIAC